MSFHKEPEYYEKTALSDLKGAWGNLRLALVEANDVENRDRLLFHVDEATSWECVRNLDRMQATLALIRNIAVQSKVPSDILEWIEIVGEDLEEVFLAISEGEKL
jgi:hypothetical protein